MSLIPSERTPVDARHGTFAAPFRSLLKVATLNLYVGFDLGPLAENLTRASDVATIEGLLERFADAYLANMPHERIRALGALIAREAPDVVGLQEAVTLKLNGFTLGNFAEELVASVREAGGPDYAVVALDTTTWGGVYSAKGLPGWVDFRDRAAVLYRRELACRPLDKGRVFTAVRSSVTVLGEPVTLRRGALALRCGDVAGRAFYFFNTHLETGDHAATQERQARELIAYIGEAAREPSLPVLVAGDFNAAESLDRTRTYAILSEGGLKDAYRRRYPDAAAEPGHTCCQREDLRNPLSSATSRYDHVFFSGDLVVTGARVFADEPFAASGAVLWPSDHFGVVAEFEWKVPGR